MMDVIYSTTQLYETNTSNLEKQLRLQTPAQESVACKFPQGQDLRYPDDRVRLPGGVLMRGEKGMKEKKLSFKVTAG